VIKKALLEPVLDKKEMRIKIELSGSR